MKIKKSELKRIIAEELEESVIEEGLWDTIVGGMVQGGHAAAKNAMSIVDLAIRELQNILENPKVSATTLTGQHLRRDGTLAPWNAPMDIVATAKENYHNLNPSHKERHIKILKDLRYKYPTNKKIAAALIALETLDASLQVIIAAAKADFDAGRALEMEQKKAALAKFYAEEAEERTRRQIARGDARKAKQQAEEERDASIRKILGILGSQMASTATNRLNEDQNLQNIIEEELQAVLAELELGQNKDVVTVADEELVGTFDYSRLEDKRFLPNQDGKTLGLTAGSRIPNGTKMVDNLPPMR